MNGKKKRNSFRYGTRNVHGITVVELLIAIFMASIVLSAAFGLYITQHNQYLVQEDVSDIQGNARSAAELLAGEIRKTGYLLPSIVTPLVTTNSNPDTITIKYATSKLAGAMLSQPMISETDALVCVGNDLSQLSPGDWVYIFDSAANLGEAFIVSDVDNIAMTIAHNLWPLTRTYPQGSRLFTVMGDKFYIDLSDSSHPNLMVQHLGQPAEVYAENIEDLDFLYYYADGSELNQLTNPDSLRMIGIDVTAKSGMENLNRVNGQYRTRNHFLKVKLRNFGLE